MTNRLKRKTALITAAGQGIGRAIAELYAKEGADVIATDINPNLLDSFSDGKKHVLDVTDKLAIKNLAKAIPTPDIIVNCAGFVPHGTILDCDSDTFDFTYDLNVRSIYHVIKAFLPTMLTNGGGSIVNIASIASSIKGIPNRFAYGTTKAAVIGLTKSISADFVTEGIRCNAICPGTIDSPSLRARIAKLDGHFEDNYQGFVNRQPMQRIGTPKEVANLALYLGSDESLFTTGATHIVDGGWVN